MNTIPDDIDFDAYLKGPNEAAMIRPAASWRCRGRGSPAPRSTGW